MLFYVKLVLFPAIQLSAHFWPWHALGCFLEHLLLVLSFGIHRLMPCRNDACRQTCMLSHNIGCDFGNQHLARRRVGKQPPGEYVHGCHYAFIAISWR